MSRIFLALAVLLGFAANAAPLDLKTPEGQLAAMRRIQCSEVDGKQWWLSVPVPLFYTNPLAGDYQQYVGGTCHATELFNFFGDIDDLNKRKRDSAKAAVSWQRRCGLRSTATSPSTAIRRRRMTSGPTRPAGPTSRKKSTQ